MASSLAPSFKATAKVQVLVLVRVPRLVRPCPATAMARVWPAHKLGRLMTWWPLARRAARGVVDWVPETRTGSKRIPITGTAPHAKILEPVKDFVNDAVEGVTGTVRGAGAEQE